MLCGMWHESGALTIVSWVVVTRADELLVGQEGHQFAHRSLVHAVAIDDGVELVEHLEDEGTWLMDGADYRVALRRQFLQQSHAGAARGAVQATGIRTNEQKYNFRCDSTLFNCCPPNL